MKFQFESKKGATHSKNGDLHCNGLMAWSVALKINSKPNCKQRQHVLTDKSWVDDDLANHSHGGLGEPRCVPPMA